MEKELMDKVPKICPSVLFVPIEKDEVNVKTSSMLYNLKGDQVKEILLPMLPYLKGNNKISEICLALSNIEANKVIEVIKILLQRNFIQIIELKSETDELFMQKKAYFTKGMNYAKIYTELKRSNIAVLGLGLSSVRLVLSLISTGIQHIKYITNGNIKIKASDVLELSFLAKNDIGKSVHEIFKKSETLSRVESIVLDSFATKILEKELRDIDFLFLSMDVENVFVSDMINKLCLDLNLPWMNCLIDSFTSTIGPLVVPHVTPCFTCYRKRIHGNLIHFEEAKKVEDYIQGKGFIFYEGDEQIPQVVQIGTNYATLELVKFLIKDITWNFPETLGKAINIDMLTNDFTVNTILKLPRCPQCGLPSKNRPTVKPWMEPYEYQE